MRLVKTFLIAVLTAASGCGAAGYNQTCASDADCQSGLTCPTVGPMTGKCTQSCTKDEECAAIGGGVCTSDVCVPQ